MKKLYDEPAAYSTADIANALMNERDRKLPVRSSFFNALVPQVSAQDAAISRPILDESQRGQPGIISKLLIGGAANAADAIGLPGVFDPSGDIRNQSWGNALKASAWLPQDTVEGISQAITAPARAYRGEISDEDMISEGLNFAGNMAIGGSAVPKPNNAAGMFGGRLAKTADHAALARAEEMAAEGAPREAIWSQTGWFKGVDGKWRFEIDDSKAGALPSASVTLAGKSEHSVPIGERIVHPEYMSAYPDAAGLNVQPIAGRMNSGAAGKYYNGKGFAYDASTPDRGRSIALHELQHDAQSREGFSLGGTPDMFWTDKRSLFGQGEAVDKYRRLAGETEARAVQKRADLTPEQRSARPPWLDYDVPESQQIVRLGNDGPSYSLDTDIARQIHEAQRLANPEADPNRLAQIARKGNEWEVSSPVGNIVAYDAPHGVQIKGAGLDEGVPKGMGYGMPLYETLANEAAAAGKPVASDQIVSRPAQNVYGAMSRRGYDVQGPPSNALRHPDSGSLIANEPIYSVSAPNVAPRDMPPPLPDNALYANSKSSGVPGAVVAEAADKTHVRSSLGFSGPSASELANMTQALGVEMRNLRTDLGNNVMSLLHKYGYDYNSAVRNTNEWLRISPTHPDFIADKRALEAPGVKEKAITFAEARKKDAALEKQIDDASRGDRIAQAYGSARPLDEQMKVYHGTDAQFKSYDSEVARSKSAASKDVGSDVAFVTPNQTFAQQFGDNVRELNLHAGKYFDPWNDIDLAAMAPFINSRTDAKQLWNKLDPSGAKQQNWGVLENKSFIDELRRRGYDGVRMAENYYDTSDVKRTAPSVAVFTRGKLTDANTGEVFFSHNQNASLPGAVIAEAADKPRGSDDALIQILQRYGLTR